MAAHKQIIDSLTSTYESNENILAFLITGSVARNEQAENSDLDLLVISNEKQPFEDKIVSEITVEIKSNTAGGFIQKMKNDPMNVYQWLDAKVIFDKENVSKKLITEAKNIYNNYKPDPKEIAGVKKWLESSNIKIKSALKNKDELALGFNVSNILWQIVSGLYLLNNKPVPPSTTAFRRIKELDKLPEDFDKLWDELLTKGLRKRTESTGILLNYLKKC